MRAVPERSVAHALEATRHFQNAPGDGSASSWVTKAEEGDLPVVRSRRRTRVAPRPPRPDSRRFRGRHARVPRTPCAARAAKWSIVGPAHISRTTGPWFRPSEAPGPGVKHNPVAYHSYLGQRAYHHAQSE